MVSLERMEASGGVPNSYWEQLIHILILNSLHGLVFFKVIRTYKPTNVQNI